MGDCMSKALVEFGDLDGGDKTVDKDNPLPAESPKSTTQVLVTPSNDTVLAPTPKKIRVEGVGNIALVGVGDDDSAVQIWSIAGMEVIDEIEVKKVMAAGTDSGNLKIIGLY